MLPTFNRGNPPVLKPSVAAAELRRGTSTSRGYDYDWEKFARAYMRKNPLCEECLHRGVDRLADVVDHMIPLADAKEYRLDPEKVWSLCNSHHNGLKRRMEAYARKAKLLTSLPEWCMNPDTRPGPFKIPEARHGS